MTTPELERDPLELIKACLLIEDDDQALSCIEETINNWPVEQECKPSLVLLTQDGCLPCEDEHQTHATAIEAGIMEVVDIHSPRGIAIAKKNGVIGAPAVLVLDCADYAIGEERIELPESALEAGV